MSDRARGIAQLRHAYAQLHAGTVVDQRGFAVGLLGPAIERLERAVAARTETSGGDD